jgi:cardiolipin synthase
VPDDSLQNESAVYDRVSGVDTTIVFPARNDSWIVGAASRSYYADLLAAGVKIYEYEGGLLHTKSLTRIWEVTLIGSANLDRRSFGALTTRTISCSTIPHSPVMRERQQDYITRSHPVTKKEVAAWPMSRRLWNNLIATLGPVL